MRTDSFTPGASSSPAAQLKQTHADDAAFFRAVGHLEGRVAHSRGLLAEVARRRSSAVSSVSPFGVTLPHQRDAQGTPQRPTRMMPSASQILLMSFEDV